MRLFTMRLRRLLTCRFAYFLVILVVVYLIAWLRVFHQSQREDNTYVDLDGDDDEDESNGDVPLKCNCLTKSQHEHQDHEHLDGEGSGPSDTPRYIQEHSKNFSPNHGKMVLILAYQRVGSSFFGKIFDLNPDIFYVYEPLDAFYQTMYGTKGGHNIPSDIYSHKNGSDRILPPDEIQGVSKFLLDMMSCQLDQLPTEFFVHSFWSFLATYMPSWQPYLQCLNHTQLINGRSRCDRLNCPHRFGAKPYHSEQCKIGLKDQKSDQFIKYKKCMDDMRQKASRCIRMMTAKCNSASFSATKTVRGTMASVEQLITSNANFRVIHLLRDPRPVSVSRMIAVTYRGLYSKNDTVLESQSYCSILRRDLILRRQLEDKYPGVFYEVVYEDFIQHPVEYAKAIYKFLDLAVPESLLPWLADKTKNKSKQKKSKVPRWKSVLTVEQSEAVLSGCKDVYDMINYDFR